MDRYAIVLAAGKGTRMKSSIYKVLHPIMGQTMVEHVVDAVSALQPKDIVTIVGCGAEEVKQTLGQRTSYVVQEEQLGTGHAVQQAAPLLAKQKGTTVVICGDTPLLTGETLQALCEAHEAQHAKATVLTATVDDPTGYGRVIRDNDGYVQRIVEHKDATEEERRVKEINTGTYCFDNEWLFEMLPLVTNNNAQQEYYLPDVIGLIQQHQGIVAAYQMDDAMEAMGVNDRVALSVATTYMQQRINRKHMMQGVTLIDPDTTYIDSSVKIGADTVIEPGVYLKGQTQIGQRCTIGMQSQIIDSHIDDDVMITSSHLQQATVHRGADVGPYARLRPGAILEEKVHIGDFVEVKNARVGARTKAGHLAYIGDASLGEDINVGCGAIFVNYDGENKHHATVGDHVFIGSNSNIVAPVTIEDNAFIAAGSTITDAIPKDAMAIARAKQTNKEGYTNVLRQRRHQQHLDKDKTE